MRKLKAAVVVAALLAVLGLSAACSPAPIQQPYMPASYPVVAGTTYCPYVYSPSEIIGCTGTPVAFRPIAPAVADAADAVATAVWVHYLTYASSYYYTDAYYTRNIAGRAHITYVNIKTYESIGSSFNTRYAALEHKYTPKFKDSHGKVVTGSKYGKLNNSIVKKLPAGGGAKPAGGVKDPGKVGGGTVPNRSVPKPPAPKPPIRVAPRKH